MSKQEASPEERAKRGKRLLIFGLFSVVVVTIVTVFLVTWLYLSPLGEAAIAIKSTAIAGGVAIVGAIIVWLVYSRVIGNNS